MTACFRIRFFHAFYCFFQAVSAARAHFTDAYWIKIFNTTENVIKKPVVYFNRDNTNNYLNTTKETLVLDEGEEIAEAGNTLIKGRWEPVERISH